MLVTVQYGSLPAMIEDLGTHAEKLKFHVRMRVITKSNMGVTEYRMPVAVRAIDMENLCVRSYTAMYADDFFASQNVREEARKLQARAKQAEVEMRGYLQHLGLEVGCGHVDVPGMVLVEGDAWELAPF